MPLTIVFQERRRLCSTRCTFNHLRRGNSARRIDRRAGMDRLPILSYESNDAHRNRGDRSPSVSAFFIKSLSLRSSLSYTIYTSWIYLTRVISRCCGIVLCLIFLPLACLPCIFHSFENTLVFCSACNRRVATVTYDGQVQIAPQPLPQPLPQQQPTQ